ncbi:MAG TPA: tRNA (adenosine(37)-N6)-dimethylallyltransferase MiaA [Sphingobacterium sp.]|nr:tRNA (adenosine(37)-N6)-dimethylallyltransferase MiaA [Sphingobacterium sp.]
MTWISWREKSILNKVDSSSTLEKKVLLAIVGPTAVGKTSLSIQLAQHYGTEIVSADSRQIYREMSIGTAKPSSAEKKGIVHYFIDSHSIQQDFSAGDYEREALKVLDTIFERHAIVVLVGGSGLFVKALCEGLDSFPPIKEGIREKWKKVLKEKGISYLQNYIRDIDPDFYASGEMKNPQRVIRAIEVYESSGLPFSHFRKNAVKERGFEVIPIGLNLEREVLYERINKRVDEMMDQGLVEEVKSLLPYRELPALQTVGYSELFACFDKVISLDDALAKVKQNTRRYAKRQITWFKKMPGIQWFSPAEKKEIFDYVERKIKE